MNELLNKNDKGWLAILSENNGVNVFISELRKLGVGKSENQSSVGCGRKHFGLIWYKK